MRGRKFISAVMIVLVWLTAASRCNAWNSTGHEIVAQIAYDHMSPQTKAVIIGILRGHPRLNEDLLHDELRAKDDDLAMFLRAATWPDMIRYPAHPMNRTEHHGRWHYVDFPYETEGVTAPQPVLEWDGSSDPANLVQAMQKAMTELKNPKTPADRKGIDICWVEHLVGDIHQPLHATSWYSKVYPSGDQGGNLVVIRNADNIVINLHSYWDSIEGMSMDPAQIRKIADRIELEHPPESLKDKTADLSVVDWAHESYEIAKPAAYLDGSLPHGVRVPASTQPSDGPPLPPGYGQTALTVADERIALAGYRLAKVLQGIAGN